MLELMAVACASSDASTAAASASTSAHTTTLSQPPADFAWQRGYSWYPDTPGAYPASKMTWYYNSGGLYDQMHASSDASTVAAGSLSQAHTTTLANPNSADFVWQRGYGWYPDTPGAYPASKWTWYYNSGGLYDQSHQLGAVPVDSKDVSCVKQNKPTPASPGHLLLCGHAFILGAAEATVEAIKTGDVSKWEENFKGASNAAANAVSPVGGYIMSEHLVKTN
ncbi:hypothetical protein GUITHDRAFT_165146 [Guillardia theta CCMP2712]|uniref:Uncharacterized protein n=1 Tax=Guillardia theta (strain CCMP2712) TaxID=905079 RepID=L1IQW4_GUITC|nr:hypothetical protein GUITHDRAFT_165146 [Guillardia theta CCMP2712]EKX38648.1 hypothetical protein GUITHDRAFT_165146 [Guillardia theta CCMP2712]|eukprot:XP_005825628.1 hypothetical protein GUITHDRAFT_165146 [Guillardia theta CCMP2712]